MAQRRKNVPPSIKRALIQQAGGKCANPGCPNRLIEMHHIEQWAVYHTHNLESMIAICPACHDAVDRGNLTISDEELYRWKGIERAERSFSGQVYVEPGPPPRLLLGSMAFMGADGIVIVDFPNQQLGLAVRDNELAFLNLSIVNSRGELLVDVIENYVRGHAQGIEILWRPGRYQVSGTVDAEYFPEWAIDLMSKAQLPYQTGDSIDLLDIQVLAPGLVRIKGVWIGEQVAFVIDESQILLLLRRKGVALALKGSGEASAIYAIGDALDQSVFRRLLPSDFW